MISTIITLGQVYRILDKIENNGILVRKQGSIRIKAHLILCFFQEKALALKIGRQKKIQIIDGQHVEVFTGDDEEDDEMEDEDDEDDLLDPSVEQKMMSVEGQDGQQVRIKFFRHTTILSHFTSLNF